jgi:hypothetical protein
MAALVPEEHERKCRPRAEAGDPAAMAGLGWALAEQGQHGEAESWYRRAAELDNTYGMTRLGVLLEGRGAKEEAWSWWRKAAAAGDADAMANLSKSLRKKNPIEAERWGWHAVATRRGRGAEPVPPEVTELATSANFGAHRSTFGGDDTVSRVRRAVPLFTALTVLAACAGLYFFGIVGGLVGGAAMGLLSVVDYFLSRSLAWEKAWVFERGLIHRTRRRELSVHPWAEIRVLRKVTRYFSKTGSYTESGFRYTLLRQNGSEFVLRCGPFVPSELRAGDICVLGETIEREVAAVRLPRALAALRQGKRIDFGDLSIDTAGITTKRRSLLWRDVKAVEMIAETIRVQGTGGWVVEEPVSAVPDALLLVTLADALRSR